MVPFCVVANAGTVNTGAVDPLAEIREVADPLPALNAARSPTGVYGAFAVLAKSVRGLFAGLERADSVALDPHSRFV